MTAALQNTSNTQWYHLPTIKANIHILMIYSLILNTKYCVLTVHSKQISICGILTGTSSALQKCIDSGVLFCLQYKYYEKSIIMLYSIMRTYSDIVNHAFRCFLYCLNGENSGSIVLKNAMVHHRITSGMCIKWNHSAISHRVIRYKLTILTFCCYHRD